MQQIKTIGIIGAGQLGKMLALAGHNLGFKFSFYDPNPESPAFGLGQKHPGSFDDSTALLKFAKSVDWLTYEFENIPAAVLEQLGDVPGCNSLSLKVSQDRMVEKNFIKDLGIEVAPFSSPASINDIQQQLASDSAAEYILKTRRMGYDGKGQLRLSDDTIRINHDSAEKLLQAPCVLEKKINFKRELSIIATQSSTGELAYYPVAENVHQNGILLCSISPCKIDEATESKARSIVSKIAKALKHIGTIAVELFETTEGELIVNEIAPRVHNTGHWSIEGSVTSQFENHIRAVSGLPLGSTEPKGYSVMCNIIGSSPQSAVVLSNPQLKLHLYGKAEKPGRKIGHITSVTQTLEDRVTAIQEIHQLIAGNSY